MQSQHWELAREYREVPGFVWATVLAVVTRALILVSTGRKRDRMALISAFVVHSLLVFVVTFVVLLAVFKHDNQRGNEPMPSRKVSGETVATVKFWET